MTFGGLLSPSAPLDGTRIRIKRSEGHFQTFSGCATSERGSNHLHVGESGAHVVLCHVVTLQHRLISLQQLTTFKGVPLEARFRGRRDEQQKFREYLALAPTVSHPLQSVDGSYAPLRLQKKIHGRQRRGYVHVGRLYQVDRKCTRYWQNRNDVPELEAGSLQRLWAVTGQITRQHLAVQPQQQPLPNVAQVVQPQPSTVVQSIAQPAPAVAPIPHPPRRTKWSFRAVGVPFSQIQDLADFKQDYYRLP